MRGGLKDYLARRLEPWEMRLLQRSYDVVGDIAVVRVPEALAHRTEEISEAVLRTNTHVKTVLRQTSPVSGECRLRELMWVAGERKTETIHKESGCSFKVDLEKCYFSPRLSYERMRIARQVRPQEVIVNMFAGVGCFSIIVAKHSKVSKVYSIDINPVANQYALENVRSNKVRHIVEPILGDSKDIVMSRLLNIADRVLMPLPERAFEYLEYAIAALKPDEGMVHYYDFTNAKRDEEPVGKVSRKAAGKMLSMNVGLEIPFGKVVRTTGPRWFQVVLDMLVRKKR